MPKNVVVCCDGTNGQFRLRNTNVVRLYELLEQDPERQVAFYDPGLGTMGATGTWTTLGQTFTRLLGLAFAFGLKERIGDAYRHVIEYWEPGDRLFLFGFSRGAYTVRALAALIHMFGVIRRGNENLIPYVTDMFGRRSEEVFRLAAEFKPRFARECPVHFVGVWDTVSSVGWIYDPVRLPYTANNPSIRIGRHAIAIDERRCFFRQNVWGEPVTGQDLKQVWFAGVHGDVGGGYAAAEEGLPNVPLWWMADEARRAGLRLDRDRVTAALARAGSRPDAFGPAHESLTGAWRLLEWWPKRWWDSRTDTYRWRIPLGERRFIPAGAIVHQSVQARLSHPDSRYAPPNLPREFALEPYDHAPASLDPDTLLA